MTIDQGGRSGSLNMWSVFVIGLKDCFLFPFSLFGMLPLNAAVQDEREPLSRYDIRPLPIYLLHSVKTVETLIKGCRTVKDWREGISNVEHTLCTDPPWVGNHGCAPASRVLQMWWCHLICLQDITKGYRLVSDGGLCCHCSFKWLFSDIWKDSGGVLRNAMTPWYYSDPCSGHLLYMGQRSSGLAFWILQ